MKKTRVVAKLLAGVTVAAAIAVGQDQVRDLAPFLRPLRDRSCCSELGVIGVRHHDEHTGETVRRLLHQAAGVGIAVETS